MRRPREEKMKAAWKECTRDRWKHDGAHGAETTIQISALTVV